MRPSLAVVPLVALLATAPLTARADGGGKPIQLSLFNPVQIFPEGDGISGFRLNLIWSKNAFMNGFDWGLVNSITGKVEGVQWSLVALDGGDFVGWQSSLVSLTDQHFTGLQMGFFNHAGSMEGLQFGVVNHAVSMKGLQLGLVNIIEHGGMLPVFIIFNFSFSGT